VREYAPEYVLWTDGATKRRWVYLPDGATIDTSSMDFWTYPKGMKLWKEFTRDGVRVETRLLEKTGDAADAWRMIAFQWLPDGSDAVARPDGVTDASGTPHDIPSTTQCGKCHGNMLGGALGFSAIQLSHDGPGVTLQTLIDEGRLSAPPAGPFTVPGDAVQRPALGYLHANCGVCHNPNTHIVPKVSMRLWLTVDKLATVEETVTYTTTINRGTSAGVMRVIPGDLANSDMHVRMSTRGGWPQMPPLGSEIVDPDGLATIDAWILSLAAPPGDGGVPDAGSDASIEGGVTDASTD
jgi:mono/diheme cytochrome c family protein